MRKTILALMILILIVFAACVEDKALAEGFGKVEWGASKNDVEAAFGITLHDAHLPYMSKFWLFVDQLNSPPGHKTYESPLNMFNSEFRAIFVFNTKEKLSQVILYREENGGIEVIMDGGKLEKDFEKYFIRQYGEVHKKTSSDIDLDTYTHKQWIGKETYVQMIELYGRKDNYKHALEISFKHEPSPF